MTAVTYLSLCTAVISETVSEQDMYRYAFRSDAASLDPHGMLDGFTVGFLQQIYEPLVRFSTDMAVEPALAEKWDWISPTQLRLQLRRNVVFHDGSPFAADDVLFSIDRAKAEGSDLKAMLGSIERAEKVDDHTVDLHMSYTDPVLLKTLASFSIMDREWSETHATLSPTQAGGTVENYAARHANGTGPYRVIERRQDVNTVLEKNSTWWGGPAYMSMPKAMEFSPVSESMAALAALRSGQLDLAYPIPPHLAAQVEKLPDVDLRKATDLRTMFLGFDFTSDILRGGDGEENPFRNRLVRQAVYMGIDRMALHRVQSLRQPLTAMIQTLTLWFQLIQSLPGRYWQKRDTRMDLPPNLIARAGDL
jgi:peptide/nickel transport system substrate-binding protein